MFRIPMLAMRPAELVAKEAPAEAVRQVGEPAGAFSSSYRSQQTGELHAQHPDPLLEQDPRSYVALIVGEQ